MTDARPGEPLVGAVMYPQGTGCNGQVPLAGTFTLRNVPASEYELASQLVSYQALNQHISRTAAQPNQTLSLRLSDKLNATAEVAGQGRRDPEGETAARRVQQVAPSVVNIVSAQVIQISPDIRVANVLPYNTRLNCGYRQTKSGRGGSDVTDVPLDAQFPHGLFVAMSDNKTFRHHRWEDMLGKDLKAVA